MRAVIQRAAEAFVSVADKVVGRIGPGLVVFLGVERDDTQSDADYIVDKVAGLRVFEDADGIPNRSVVDISGEVLLVSQFTLCADARHGRRPSYIRAARPELALPLYEYAAMRLGRSVPVATGKFQAEMRVSLVNDGPHTILLDSKKEF